MQKVLKGLCIGLITGSLFALAMHSCATKPQPSVLPTACFDVDVVKLKCGERAV